MRLVFALFTTTLPWPLRRRLLNLVPGFEIHPETRIGLSLVFPREGLVLERGASIGHLNVIWNLDRLHLSTESRISHLNWISAIRVGQDPIFDEYPDRRPELILERCAGITTRHYFDCSDRVHLEEFALIGGLRSTVMAHALNLQRGRQGCGPIRIGRHSFVATNCVIIGGAGLPDHSILGASSLLLEDPGDTYRLYAGSPAVAVKEYSEDLPYFQRTTLRNY